MSNLTDYIKWRGDLTLDERPFTEVDSMVLCLLSYLDFTDILTPQDTMTVHDLVAAVRKRDAFNMLTIDGEPNKNGYEQFVNATADSRRYGALVIESAEAIFDTEKDIQFAAVTFRLSPSESFLAFRGTDDSLTGWKEDFMISFTKIPSQEASLSYARRKLQNHPDQSFRIAGHSKGGNLALYTGLYLSDTELTRIPKIYILDGPGLCPDVFEDIALERIDEKTVRITPEYSVIGMIFEPKFTDSRIVKSSETGIMQHSLVSWQVCADGLVEAEKHDPGSVWVNQVVDTWVSGVDNKGRETFVNQVFDALGAGNAVTFTDMLHQGPEGFEKVLASVIHLDPSTKRTAAALPLTAFFGELGERIQADGIISYLRSSLAARTLLMLFLGVLFLLVPSALVPSATGLLLFLALAAETIYTVSMLAKSHWDLSKNQYRAFINLISAAVFLVLILKPGALELIGSGLFGAGFLAAAYFTGERIQDHHGSRVKQTWNFIELLVFGLSGLYLLVAPGRTLGYGLFMSGLYLVIDGLVHCVWLLMHWHEKYAVSVRDLLPGNPFLKKHDDD